MGISGGKKYNAKAINQYFSDIAEAFENFKKLVAAHSDEAAKIIDENTWVGEGCRWQPLQAT